MTLSEQLEIYGLRHILPINVLCKQICISFIIMPSFSFDFKCLNISKELKNCLISDLAPFSRLCPLPLYKLIASLPQIK